MLEGQILDLMLSWEEHAEQGQSITPEELCRDCPEYLEEVRRRIVHLNEVNQELKGSSHANDVRHDSQSPNDQIGPYKLLEQLGQGGMGEVWQASQSAPVRRQVALKLIKLGMDTQQVLSRFEAERQALALMDHANIAKVLDAGKTENGRPYFVMELVKGIPLTTFCDQERLTIRERLELFIPICHAIQHAHQKGIIHRDLKPSNILVGLSDGKPTPKIIDFGIAKAISQKLTEETLYTGIGAMIGTPEYMAPEQAEVNNVDIDTRADIYSLGVVLYELLTGGPPFSRQQLRDASYDEMLRLIREVEPPKPSTKLSNSNVLPDIASRRHVESKRLTKSIQGELDWIVMKCLEKERGRRYETANGLAMEIQRCLADEPVLAGPPSKVYRVRKFVRRNKSGVVAVGMIFLALTGGIVGAMWGLHTANNARREETLARIKADEERDVAVAIQNFLQFDLLKKGSVWEQAEVLRQAGEPLSDISKNPSIKELLDRASRQLTPELIEKRFPNKPLTQAAILHTIGATYQDTSDYESAFSHLLRAWQIRRNFLGPEHRDTIQTSHNLARSYLETGRTIDGITFLEKFRDESLGNLPDDHPDKLTTFHNLGAALVDAGRYSAGIRMLTQVVEGYKKKGVLSSEAVVSINCLANAHRKNNDHKEALRLFEIVRDHRVKTLGVGHPSTLATFSGLAAVYADNGRFDEAVELFTRAYKGQEQLLGENHSDTLTTLNNLATAYNDSNRYDEAIQILERVYDVRVKKLGRNHSHALASLNNLAAAHKRAGNLASAADLFDKVRLGAIETLGPFHPNTLTTIANLSTVYLDLKRFADAEHLLRDLLKVRSERHSEEWATFQTMSFLGKALAGQFQFDQAEPLLCEGYLGMKTRSSQMPEPVRTRNLSEGVSGLVSLYDAWNKPDEAAKWRKELEQLKAAEKKPDEKEKSKN